MTASTTHESSGGLGAKAATVVAAGVIIRLLLLMLVDPAQSAFGGDAASYVAEARRILAGHWPGAFRPPLYPAFLALTLPLGWWAPLVAQSALTIGSGVAATLRGRFLCGLLIASCPFLALFDFRLLSESLYINLAFLAWLAPIPIVSGLLLGAAILTRNTLLLLPLFALVALRTRQSAIVAVVAYLVVAPWLFLAGSAGGGMGLNLWIGTWERNGDWYLNGLEHPDFPPYAFASAAEERTVRSHWLDDPTLRRVAVDRIEHHPMAVAMTWVERYPRLWIGTRSDIIPFRLARGSLAWTLIKAAFFSLNAALLAFGLWGALKPDRFLVPVIYVALFYVPFHNVETRYSLIALPFLMCLGARRLAGLHIAVPFWRVSRHRANGSAYVCLWERLR